MTTKKRILVSLFISHVVIFVSMGFNERNIFLNDNLNPAISSVQLNANSISTWFRNNGGFNRDPITSNAGFEWPKGSSKFASYTSGIWLGCVAGNDTLTAVAEFAYDFIPGYLENGLPQYDPSYRIYSIRKNETSTPDYLNWPSYQGAYTTNDGKPYLIGDQTIFASIVEARPHITTSTSDSTLKAQIMQTVWVYDPADMPDNPVLPLSNTIFIEYRIINKSNKIWTNMFTGMFNDDEIGSGLDDKVGCDINLNMGFGYNSGPDAVYGNNPPAAGFVILRGATKFTGNLNDTMKYFQPFGSNKINIKTGFKDLGMTVFNTWNRATPQPSDPLTNVETFRVLNGLWRLGESWINPVTNDTTTFVFSGDPVTGSGWNTSSAFDRHSVTITGPAVVNPGDTLSIVVAQIIARGNSNLNSITQLRRSAKVIKNFYENNLKPVPSITSPVVSSIANGSGKINLSWDNAAENVSYPNPLSGGVHRFQGYNIYQINTFSQHPSKEDTVMIASFDKPDGLKNIYDSIYINGMSGIFYGVVQNGTDNGISRYITIDRDTISRKNFINGTEYKFAVTAYYYDSTGSLLSLPKVRESEKNNITKVTPQNYSSGTIAEYSPGDSVTTDQRSIGVLPLIIDPSKLISANYTSVVGGTITSPSWTLSRTYNGITTVLFQNDTNFSGQTDNEIADGQMFIHRLIRDSSVVRDPGDPYSVYFGMSSLQKGWQYYPEGKGWFTGPDTSAINTAKIIDRRQFQSRSLGMSFPTSGTFKNNVSRVKANESYFKPVNAGKPILTGGPLRKIKIVFGMNSRAYRYVPTDTNYINTPYSDMVTIPFSVYAADDLDSSAGTLRQLNVGFMDSDNDGKWDPDTSKLGNYHFTYIFASSYNASPDQDYTSKNPGLANPTNGFPSLDVMYAWLPRVKSVNGISQSWSEGDTLTVWPYRLTKPEFVPGYPVKYSWTITGTQINNRQYASAEVGRIKVFPNPYYGFSELEYNDAQDKFIYISHLPMKATIYIYSLDGVPVKKINRETNDPTSSLEKWDLKNNDGSYVASGMYIVYVDCGEFGVKTLKIAVFQR